MNKLKVGDKVKIKTRKGAGEYFIIMKAEGSDLALLARNKDITISNLIINTKNLKLV